MKQHLKLVAAVLALTCASFLVDRAVGPVDGRRSLRLAPAGVRDLSLVVDAGIDRWGKVLQTLRERRREAGEKVCVAVVDDGVVSTAAVIDENGFFHLALPEGHETEYGVECVRYDEAGGEEGVDEINAERYPIAHRPPPSCDRKGFHPGHYDVRGGAWVDGCTGRRSSTASDGEAPGDALFSVENCPVVGRTERAAGRDVWVSFVGDSVTRQLLTDGFQRIGIDMLKRGREWRTDRTGWVRRHPDFMLLGIDDASSGSMIWLSYTMEFIDGNTLSTLGLPYTWGDFVRERKEGRRHADPDWPDERAPDVVYFSPGYHASQLNATVYGNILDRILTQWQFTMANTYHAPMPPMHVPLNILPAPWLIPDKFAYDRKQRTRLNEYRKNRAILDVVKKHDFVEGVVDFFSVALPLNGHPGADDTRHRDAVHVLDDGYLRVAADLAVQAICGVDA